MPDLTPEKLAELRRLLDATETPWALWDGYGPDGNGDMRVARIGHLSGSGIRADPDSADIYGRREAFELLASAVNALPALLDAAAERDEIAGRLAHLLCDLTGGRMSKTSYPVPVMAQEIEQYLSECHESDLKDERDALAAKLAEVRALHIAHDCTSHAGMATICAHRPGICLACREPLPCPTIRALDTTPDAGGES